MSDTQTPAGDATSASSMGALAPVAPVAPAAPSSVTPGAASAIPDGWAHKFVTGIKDDVAKDWLPVASRYQTPEDYIKADIELRKSAIFVPKEDAKPEAWDNIFKRLGRPDTPKDYKWNHLQDAPPLEETDLAVRDNYGEIAHRAGMTQKQIDMNVQWHDMNRKVQTDSFIARANQTAETNTKTLRAALGENYDRTIGLHSTAVKTYAGNKLESMAKLRLEDGTFMLDHPDFITMMARIGAERAEDSHYANTFNPSGVADAKAQIDKIEAEARAKGLGPTHPQYPKAELKVLYDRVYGTKPLSMNGFA